MGKFTRREFIEDSLRAAAAAAAVPLVTRCSNLPKGKTAAAAAFSSGVLRVGVVGVNGRGRGHVSGFKKSPDSEVVAICDPDSAVIGGAMNAAPKAKYYKDIRELLDDQSIDVISIATPNHWHSLAAIWALQAGKHVYVEKPISHDLYEGRKVVEAVEKYGKILQVGTQARSQRATCEAIAWLQQGGLGKIKVARGLCYKRRESIGKVTGPQDPPASLDYDLWTGPAELTPLMRKDLHYEWHWVFNTGNGDIGNQGVHQIDIARWALGKNELPKRVVSLGGRLGYDDDGDTPNTLISHYDYGDQQIIFEVRGLQTKAYKTVNIGVIFHCENGYLVAGSYTKIVAFDLDGKIVKTFTGGGNHYQNFLDAVKSGNPKDLHAPAIEGHLSASLCHLGNISYQLGKPQELSATDTPFGDRAAANETFRRYHKHLQANGLDPAKAEYAMGPVLAFDSESEQFTGEHAAEANALSKRPYREPFLIPATV